MFLSLTDCKGAAFQLTCILWLKGQYTPNMSENEEYETSGVYCLFKS